MTNLELPKKYTDYIKGFVKVKGVYELTLNPSCNTKNYFFESKNKKECIRFLKENLKSIK